MSNSVMATLIEPYRRGTSFSAWIQRLEFSFIANEITPNRKKAFFVTLGGQAVFEELMLLYPNTDLVAADTSYTEMIAKLKTRFDKIEPDIVQRIKFNKRVQQPNESLEDFVLAVKLQAEFCGFDAYKEIAIRDRILAGLLDKDLQQRLLTEQNISLATLERLITTWEMAGGCAKSLHYDSQCVAVKYLSNARSYGYKEQLSNNSIGSSNISQQFRTQGYSKGSIKDRLGFKAGFKGTPTKQRAIEGAKAGRVDSHRVRFQQANWKDGNRVHKRDYTNTICHFCGMKGHIRKRCFKLKKMQRDTVNLIDLDQPGTSEEGRLTNMLNRLRTDDSEEEDERGDCFCMNVASTNNYNVPCLLKLTIENKLTEMEVDCGSSVSVMGRLQYLSTFENILTKSKKELRVISGSKLQTVGEATVLVKHNNKEVSLPLLVLDCKNNFVPLMGRSWLDIFYPDWRQYFQGLGSVNNILLNQKDEVIGLIKNKYEQIFTKDFSKPIVGFEAELVLRDDTPIFKKAYNVPYRLRDRILGHLEKLEKEKVITPIQTSEWASPVIAVMKKNNDIRLVIDCKVSLNKLLIPNTYPLPVAQDLFASLAGCKVFCTLDLEGAYTQLMLTEKSRKIMVINTLKGLYTYNRLPQGASSSASIFQQIMDQILYGLENVVCYLDDVLIAGSSFDDCKNKLMLVLDRLLQANVKINLEKCKFFVTSLEYLGHIISANGLAPCPDKVATIRQAKEPKNVSELKSFLGLINFYHKFIPKLSSTLYHLYNLLKKDVRFVWDSNCQRAFDICKDSLLCTNFLEFYDPKKPIVLVSDASGYGIGGVLAHIVDGVEKPISFASFSLNDAQKRYPILHLEALALVCTVKKFHKFLYGQRFTVFTDHKPLVGIFGKTGQNSILVTRLQRYILELSIYEFDIQYRPSNKMGNADFCSRFPLEQMVPRELDADLVNSLNFYEEFPIDYKLIAIETKHDQFLQQIVLFMQSGWPERIDKRFRDVFANQNDLEIVEGCLLYSGRVIIPLCLQMQVLKLLHGNHAGMVKMKRMARCFVYWFGINKDIERFVSECDACGSMRIISKPKCESEWTPTTRPFSRIHIDFFYFRHNTYLLIIDSYSKWLEVILMKNGTDSKKVLKKLVEFFARFGLPDVLVSDGGPPFNSHNFINFLERQGIRVLKSPPYNPSSNGQAERLVRTVKEVLKRFLLDEETKGLDLEDQINLFLFNFRNFNMTMEGEFPSQKLFTYTPKTILDLINPKNTYKRHLVPQTNPHKHFIPQKSPGDDSNNCNVSHNKTVKQDHTLDNLISGDEVWYKNHNPHDNFRWCKAIFLKRVSKNIFQIRVGNVDTSAHRNQLRMVKIKRNMEEPRMVLATGRGLQWSGNDDDGDGFNGFSDESGTNTNMQGFENLVGQQVDDLSTTRIGFSPLGTASNVGVLPRNKSRKRKFVELSDVNSPMVRRSKRTRKRRLDPEFHYT